MNTRVLLAVVLWLGTVALVVVTLAVSNDSCDAPDWIVWLLIGVGFAAAAATFMSLRTRVSVALAIGLFVGLVRWPRGLLSSGGSLGRRMHRLTLSGSPTGPKPHRRRSRST